MKPLVYYCRWHDAKLRLHGRDETAVWGQLVYHDGQVRTTREFKFDLQTWQLTLLNGEESETIQLDEMGVIQSHSS